MKIHSTFKTKKGTELPLLDLKGKPYMQVQHRLVWFVEENPFFHVDSQAVQLTADSVIMRTKVSVLAEDGRVVRAVTAYKAEDKKGFADFIEKAETGSLGRALLQLGYGTAFAGQELDEGMRLADSPMMPATFTKPAQEQVTAPQANKVEATVSASSSESGSFSGRRRRKVESLIEVQDDGI